MVFLSPNTNVNVEFVTVLSTNLANLKLQLPPLRKTKLTKNILVLSQTKSLKKTETSKFGFTIGWVCSSEFIPIVVRRRRQRWKTNFDVWFLVTFYQFTHHAFFKKIKPSDKTNDSWLEGWSSRDFDNTSILITPFQKKGFLTSQRKCGF